MKLAPERYPHVVDENGRPVDSPSPFAAASLEADAKAFAALMRHLKTADPQRTVLMVQVENEPGTGGNLRDYSPAAQKLFEGPVPADVLKAMNVRSERAFPELAGSLRPRRRGLLPRLGRGEVHRAGGRRRQGGLPAPPLCQRRAGNAPLRGVAGPRQAGRAGQLRKRRP